jgi:site-specific DNA recombinase
MPREEWIEIPVPLIVDPAVFEAAQAQIEENRRRKRERKRGHYWLLQGSDGLPALRIRFLRRDRPPRSRKYDPMNTLRHYRRTRADGCRFSGKAVCNDRPVRSDQLELVVRDQVRVLGPRRVADEYRRIAQARNRPATSDEIICLDRQMTRLRSRIARLIESYTRGRRSTAPSERSLANWSLAHCTRTQT